MEPKILLVEDRERLLNNIVSYVKDINEDDNKKQRYGIERFLIHTAGWAAKARELLRQAANSSEPYDILILDLSLPREELRPGESMVEDPTIGLEIIDYAKEIGAAEEIIVYTAFPKFKYIVDAFRRGAVDFIAKRSDDKVVLQKAVLAAWERVLARESARTLEERFKTLVPYAEQVLTYQFGKCFSRLIQSVSHEVEAMKGDLADRLGLDAEKDTHDPLLWHLVTIQKSVRDAKKDWSSLPQTRSSEKEDEVLKEVVIEDELNKIVGDVLPCLTLKRAKAETPHTGQTRALSFAHDVPTILRELIVGGLGEAGEQNGLGLGEAGESGGSRRVEDWPVRMSVKVSAMDEKAEVRFEDNLRPIDSGAAESINKGLEVALDDSFGRVWGLSVAQHAALRGGGRLVVEPSLEGNVISYFVPLRY
jgi:FixJ family two-component response regulator